MGKEQLDYISYLLRMWRVNGEEAEAWRASLENPHTGERIGFASLDKLFVFLRQQAGVAPAQMTVKVSERKSIEDERTFGSEAEV
ncbi:MAG: hypothetical protein JSV36_10635 [Anaerolineae bacterium]|nr:MAG: hypothetical protein JSV36_10635 [Anaerolineae bacterium]